MSLPRLVLVALLSLFAALPAAARQPTAPLVVSAASESGPLIGARVTVGGVTVETDASGRVTVDVRPGTVDVLITSTGFLDLRESVTVTAAGAALDVRLVPVPEVEEEVVVVATTRTGRRLDDQPTRVEVLGREEIEEKMLMTPGDIVMMLNETGGLRVQATSPSIGAASVRVQGMKGRYTRILSDGLPLFGQQVGGLGLLQIPPMDLGQVEVIKGVASAFYGAGAMGGVVNLLSRRPSDVAAADLLINQSTLGATDAVLFLSSAANRPWRATLLTGGHRQTRNDRDDDGWADLAGYERAVVRPRLFWEDGKGTSALLTLGATVENRAGGTMDGAALSATGASYSESLETRRYDVGATLQSLVRERYVVTGRGAAAWQRHDHRFGETRERDRHDNLFGEVALRGANGRHTWVAGVAYERDTYTPVDLPRFAYTFDVPGLFVQDDVELGSGLSVSAGVRVDRHSEYGTFVSPRVAALIRQGSWTSRLSFGRGFFGATPLTEETEAAGLTRLESGGPLRAERGTSVSADLTRAIGPLSLTVTGFGSRVADPIAVERDVRYELFNRAAATTNLGADLLGTIRHGAWTATSSYTYVRSREGTTSQRQDVPLTPRHSASLIGMWEEEDWGRAGLEVYYTGRQRLEENPYRDVSEPYVIVGLLAEKRLAKVRLFLNAENLTNVRQTRWDPLVRPARGVDGRWTVDAWAPLDGFALNGGVRVGF